MFASQSNETDVCAYLTQLPASWTAWFAISPASVELHSQLSPSTWSAHQRISFKFLTDSRHRRRKSIIAPVTYQNAHLELRGFKVEAWDEAQSIVRASICSPSPLQNCNNPVNLQIIGSQKIIVPLVWIRLAWGGQKMKLSSRVLLLTNSIKGIESGIETHKREHGQFVFSTSAIDQVFSIAATRL